MTPEEAARWENDPHELPWSKERDQRAREGAFASIRDNNQAGRLLPKYRAEYEAWLKNNPKED